MTAAPQRDARPPMDLEEFTDEARRWLHDHAEPRLDNDIAWSDIPR